MRNPFTKICQEMSLLTPLKSALADKVWLLGLKWKICPFYYTKINWTKFNSKQILEKSKDEIQCLTWNSQHDNLCFYCCSSTIKEYSKFCYKAIAGSKIRAWGIGYILANFGYRLWWNNSNGSSSIWKKMVTVVKTWPKIWLSWAIKTWPAGNDPKYNWACYMM